MTTLSYLNEPGVLWNLKARYQLDGIYTYTGSILIAVNPFASLPLLYGQHMMQQYKGRPLGELSPHVYAIADAAFKQMRKDSRSQSILVCTVLPAIVACGQLGFATTKPASWLQAPPQLQTASSIMHTSKCDVGTVLLVCRLWYAIHACVFGSGLVLVPVLCIRSVAKVELAKQKPAS